MVRDRRRLDRTGDPDHLRLGLRAGRPADHRRRARPAVPTSCPDGRLRCAGRAEPAHGPRPGRSRLRADAHSELLGSYPWGETTPSQTTENLPGQRRHPAGPAPRVPRPRAHRRTRTARRHDWAAAFGSSAGRRQPPGSARTSAAPRTRRWSARHLGPDAAPAQPESLRRHRIRSTVSAVGLTYRIRAEGRPGADGVVRLWAARPPVGPTLPRRNCGSILKDTDPSNKSPSKINSRQAIERAQPGSALPDNPLIAQQRVGLVEADAGRLGAAGRKTCARAWVNAGK